MAILLRPLTLGELLDRVFQLYRSRFWIFIGIAALPYLPVLGLQTVALWLPKAASPRLGVAGLTAFGVSLLLRLLAAVAGMSATIIVVSAAYLDLPITIGEAYSRVSGMLLRVFFIMIGMSLGIGMGVVLLIIPGIILALMWALAIPVAVLEDTGLSESLSRSRHLTAGHWSRVFAIYLLYFALLMALTVGLALPIGTIGAMKGVTAGAFHHSQLARVINLIIAIVVSSLVTPVLTISLSLMYYDERVRKEAFDIHLMMNALDAGPAASTAATAG